ncbi:cytochrome o ubiquinol oxidase subunit 2 [Tistlia consotensis]|uniref:Cytochrome o ubiquinol oxidase subunit 2 n=1 Tax=Tistlia consotensis USBA 355 TaxID=560819 RepID=A0A1Y6CR79_9PROT|nr:cytochrome ubiquinol oxidase subunit II [Tistlia consotensis]SMF84600.1 cytochrome o ubiquinol oxidase subunit 2 [Tistlia consotensis USBA 355]SNS37271.1 cytochrome o ubiquinol oxidase subunit 2 [Tistlia consotensis]
MRPARRLRRVGAALASAVVLLAAPAARAGEALSFLDPQGPVAAAQRDHFYWVIGLVMIVVLPVVLATPILAWRYRYGARKAAYRPKWHFSWSLEIAIWGIPVAVVAALVWLLWVGTHALDPYKAVETGQPPLRVQVVGYDWKWLFIYPDQGIASVGELAFPVDRPLALRLTSATVMQSFFVPALGSQIYAMNGMVTRLHLAADRPGRFLGENTQYNGRGFHEQRFVARALPPADFAAWVARLRAQGAALGPAVAAALAERGSARDLARALGLAGEGAPVVGFRAVPPRLFEQIVERAHAVPAAGGAREAAR